MLIGSLSFNQGKEMTHQLLKVLKRSVYTPLCCGNDRSRYTTSWLNEKTKRAKNNKVVKEVEKQDKINVSARG